MVCGRGNEQTNKQASKQAKKQTYMHACIHTYTKLLRMNGFLLWRVQGFLRQKQKCPFHKRHLKRSFWVFWGEALAKRCSRSFKLQESLLPPLSLDMFAHLLVHHHRHHLHLAACGLRAKKGCQSQQIPTAYTRYMTLEA